MWIRACHLGLYYFAHLSRSCGCCISVPKTSTSLFQGQYRALLRIIEGFFVQGACHSGLFYGSSRALSYKGSYVKGACHSGLWYSAHLSRSFGCCIRGSIGLFYGLSSALSYKGSFVKGVCHLGLWYSAHLSRSFGCCISVLKRSTLTLIESTSRRVASSFPPSAGRREHLQ